MPKLLLKFEAAFIKEIDLDKPSVTIGRKPDNDIVLEHATVSSHHCKIYSAGESYFVEDLNSTNGTYLNGKRILKAGLKPNDAIGIVKYSLIFMDDKKPDAPRIETQAGRAPEKPVEVPQQKPKLKGFLEVMEGVVDKQEYELTNLSTYIGKSTQAHIPIKSSGIFASVPEIAAAITLRPEGFYLIPIKEGYPKLNGIAITEKVMLNNGDIIETGATKFKFCIK